MSNSFRLPYMSASFPTSGEITAPTSMYAADNQAPLHRVVLRHDTWQTHGDHCQTCGNHLQYQHHRDEGCQQAVASTCPAAPLWRPLGRKLRNLWMESCELPCFARLARDCRRSQQADVDVSDRMRDRSPAIRSEGNSAVQHLSRCGETATSTEKRRRHHRRTVGPQCRYLRPPRNRLPAVISCLFAAACNRPRVRRRLPLRRSRHPWGSVDLRPRPIAGRKPRAGIRSRAVDRPTAVRHAG